MYTPVELDKVRNFRYGMKAISLIEKKFKKPMANIDMDNLTMDEMATVFWAGLVHEDKNLTPDRVMDIIDEYGKLSKVAEAMRVAMEDAFGEEEAGTEKKE